MNNFQRIGAISNAHVGRDFEVLAQNYFLEQEGLRLTKSFPIEIGVGTAKKSHRFDLGSDEPRILVECKSHRWTETGNMPSAKVTVWTQAIFYFFLVPPSYRAIMFVLRDINPKTNVSLADYYIRNYGHLIPGNVELMEFDEQTKEVIRKA